MHGGATWRRLKIAAEVRKGMASLPRLPVSELVRMLGLLALVRDDRFSRDREDEASHEAHGLVECGRLGLDSLDEAGLRDAVVALARAVDAHALL